MNLFDWFGGNDDSSQGQQVASRKKAPPLYPDDNIFDDPYRSGSRKLSDGTIKFKRQRTRNSRGKNFDRNTQYYFKEERSSHTGRQKR